MLISMLIMMQMKAVNLIMITVMQAGDCLDMQFFTTGVFPSTANLIQPIKRFKTEEPNVIAKNLNFLLNINRCYFLILVPNMVKTKQTIGNENFKSFLLISFVSSFAALNKALYISFSFPYHGLSSSQARLLQSRKIAMFPF